MPMEFDLAFIISSYLFVNQINILIWQFIAIGALSPFKMDDMHVVYIPTGIQLGLFLWSLGKEWNVADTNSNTDI